MTFHVCERDIDEGKAAIITSKNNVEKYIGVVRLTHSKDKAVLSEGCLIELPSAELLVDLSFYKEAQLALLLQKVCVTCNQHTAWADIGRRIYDWLPILFLRRVTVTLASPSCLVLWWNQLTMNGWMRNTQPCQRLQIICVDYFHGGHCNEHCTGKPLARALNGETRFSFNRQGSTNQERGMRGCCWWIVRNFLSYPLKPPRMQFLCFGSALWPGRWWGWRSGSQKLKVRVHRDIAYESPYCAEQPFSILRRYDWPCPNRRTCLRGTNILLESKLYVFRLLTRFISCHDHERPHEWIALMDSLKTCSESILSLCNVAHVSLIRFCAVRERTLPVKLALAPLSVSGSRSLGCVLGNNRRLLLYDLAEDEDNSESGGDEEEDGDDENDEDAVDEDGADWFLNLCSNERDRTDQ